MDIDVKSTEITQLDAESPVVKEFLQWCWNHDIAAGVHTFGGTVGTLMMIESTIFYMNTDELKDDFADACDQCDVDMQGLIRSVTYSWHIKKEFLPTYQQVVSVMPNFSMQTLCSLPQGMEAKVNPYVEGNDSDYTQEDFDSSEINSNDDEYYGWSEDEPLSDTYLNEFNPPLRQYNPHMVEWKRNCGDKATRLSVEGRWRFVRNIPAYVNFQLKVLLDYKDQIQAVLLKHFGPDSPS